MYIMHAGIHLFTGFSLVDITATGVIRSSTPDAVDRTQQRDGETVIQCMGLRTQPQNITDPISSITTSDCSEFGELYSGKQKVWLWSWTVEAEGIYDLHNKPLGGLMQDFEQVPIVTGLEETARFMLPIFYPYGPIKNIYFKQSTIS